MKIEKLPEICKIQYGYPFDSALFSEKEGNPLIRIRDVVRGYTETYTTEKCSDEYLVNQGDILIGMDGMFNVAKWKGGQAFLNQRVCRLIPGEKIDSDYLYYFMPKALKKIEEATPFVTVKHLKAKQLNNIKVPLVPLMLQKQIAQQLVTIDHLMGLRKEQLQKLDELVKSRFIEMFGDPVINSKNYPIRKLSDYIDSLTSGSRGWAKYFDDNGKEWFITIKNVKDGKILLDNMQKISPPNNAEARRTKVKNGDLLISITADLGRTAVVSDDIEKHGAYINQHLTCVRLNRNTVNPKYISFYLESEAGKRQFEAKNQSAVKAGLNFNAIKNLLIVVPSLMKQNQFVDFRENIDKSKLAIQKSLDDLETLKKSLMQQYFG